MRTTIDARGRIFVPEALREELALHGGQELEDVVRDGRLEIEVPPVEMRLADRGGVMAAVTDHAMPTLTHEEVRRTIDRVRS